MATGKLDLNSEPVKAALLASLQERMTNGLKEIAHAAMEPEIDRMAREAVASLEATLRSHANLQFGQLVVELVIKRPGDGT